MEELLPENDDMLNALEDFAIWMEMESKNFKKKVKALKPFLISENIVLPVNWEEIIASYYLENEKLKDLLEEKKMTEIDFWSIPPISKAEIVKFAKNQTDSLREILESKRFNPIEPETIQDESFERFSGAIRYLVHDEFFELKKEYKTLPEKLKIKLLSIILEKGSRTTKGYKNGEEKYINPKNIAAAKELIEKVKKGDFL